MTNFWVLLFSPYFFFDFDGFVQILPVSCRSKKTFYNSALYKIFLCLRAAQLRKFRYIPMSVGIWYHLQETFFLNVDIRIQEGLFMFFIHFFLCEFQISMQIASQLKQMIRVVFYCASYVVYISFKIFFQKVSNFWNWFTKIRIVLEILLNFWNDYPHSFFFFTNL